MESRSASVARRSVAVIVLGGVLELRRISSSLSPSVAQLQPGDQRAMHQQVGIAADRRGEMRVFASEPGRNGRYFPGRIPPGSGCAARSRSPAAPCRCRRRAFSTRSRSRGCSWSPGCREISKRRAESCADCRASPGWRGMHAVHAGQVAAFQFLGGADIGEDHELLDQPVAVEPRARWRRSSPGRRRRAPPCAPAGRDRACRAPARAWRAARGKRGIEMRRCWVGSASNAAWTCS